VSDANGTSSFWGDHFGGCTAPRWLLVFGAPQTVSGIVSRRGLTPVGVAYRPSVEQATKFPILASVLVKPRGHQSVVRGQPSRLGGGAAQGGSERRPSRPKAGWLGVCGRGVPGALRERFPVACGTGVHQTTAWSNSKAGAGPATEGSNARLLRIPVRRWDVPHARKCVARGRGDHPLGLVERGLDAPETASGESRRGESRSSLHQGLAGAAAWRQPRKD
jgi:hypothetical protein